MWTVACLRYHSTAGSRFRLQWLLLSEWKLVSLYCRNQSSTSSLGEVSDRGGHPARSPEARRQADDQWPDLGLRGLQRAGVGEWFCEYPPRGQCRHWVWRVCQSCLRHSLWGRLGLWPQVGQPGQIVSSTKGDFCSRRRPPASRLMTWKCTCSSSSVIRDCDAAGICCGSLHCTKG